MEDNRKKVVAPLIIGILCMFILLGGATYAYFVTNTTNSFGTKTITGQADATGSVALIGTNASLYLNLDRTLMAQGANDTTYWAVTTNTTPSTTQNVVTVGSTSVNGAGYFNCNYTLNVAASGTNNMYTAFQGMSGKSERQIFAFLGDEYFIATGGNYGNGLFLDFYTANLFPSTFTGHIKGISANNPGELYGIMTINNSSPINQTALAGTDIIITATVTSFTCKAATIYLVDGPAAYSETKYWNNLYSEDKYNSNNTLINNSYNYYIKETINYSQPTLAKKHFYSFVMGDYYNNLESCLLSSAPNGTTCIKVDNAYSQTFLNGYMGMTTLFDTLSECENYWEVDSCVEYNKNDIYEPSLVTSDYETCGIINNTEYCLKENDWNNRTTIQSDLEELGATCTIGEHNLICYYGEMQFLMSSTGNASINIPGYNSRHYCELNPVKCSYQEFEADS